MIKIKIKNSQNQRQVIKVSDDGNFAYKAKYIDIKETHLFFLWSSTPFKTITTKKERLSVISFDKKEIAELYAKYTTSDVFSQIGYNDVIADFIGGEQFKKYGNFVIDYSLETVYFRFNDKYRDSLGRFFRFGDTESFLNSIDTNFDRLKKHINKFDIDCEIVSSFDVVTLETIPYENIKASSAELEELKRLLAQYKKDMEQYQEFLKKLLTK